MWRYFEAYSDGTQLSGWHDAGDLLLAGDFRNLGHDQVMFVNRGAGDHRLLVADFTDGAFPAEQLMKKANPETTILASSTARTSPGRETSAAPAATRSRSSTAWRPDPTG
jgi:hypothetical protein